MSAFTALHEQQQIQAPPIVYVEYRLRVAPANSTSASALEVIDLVQSDGEEEDSMTE